MRVGWGQQLRYSLDFGNEPTLEEDGPVESSFVDTGTYTEGRRPISTGTEFTDRQGYYGKPAIGVVLRVDVVDVVGEERAGPQRDAPVVADRSGPKGAVSDAGGDTAGTGEAGWSAARIAAVVGGAVVLTAAVALLFVRRRTSRAAGTTTRGGA